MVYIFCATDEAMGLHWSGDIEDMKEPMQSAEEEMKSGYAKYIVSGQWDSDAKAWKEAFLMLKGMQKREEKNG